MKVTGKEVSIEDLFPEDFYLKQVAEFYKQQLSGAGVTTLSLQPGDQLVKRVERFFEGIGVPFNKGSIAKRVCEEINRMKSLEHLPAGTKVKAEALIGALNKALS
jgi:hypothetical protein